MKLNKRLKRLWPDLLAGHPTAVHETRKITRRAQAALRADGGHKKARLAWRDLRRAISPVRDWDAVGVHLREGLTELGAGAQVLKRFDHAWMTERAARWAQLQLPEHPPRYRAHKHHRARLHHRLERDWQRLIAEGPQHLAAAEDAEWHVLRKQLKALRYTWELQGEPPADLLALLEALGRVQDANVALEAIRHPALPATYRARLEARERVAQVAALAEARRLWPIVAALPLP